MWRTPPWFSSGVETSATVWMTGIEPVLSRPPVERFCQAKLHPEIGSPKSLSALHLTSTRFRGARQGTAFATDDPSGSGVSRTPVLELTCNTVYVCSHLYPSGRGLPVFPGRLPPYLKPHVGDNPWGSSFCGLRLSGY